MTTEKRIIVGGIQSKDSRARVLVNKLTICYTHDF
jgi:hypothetical protein